MLDLVQNAKSIALTTHLNPDGDGFCASLALQRILTQMGKPNLIITDADDLSRYVFLLENQIIPASEILPFSKCNSTEFDLVFVLDCNSYDRLGERRSLVDKAKWTILLDHHVVEHNPIKADLSFIDTKYASVGAIIYSWLKPQIIALNEGDRLFVANCLYTTILNDTNNFTNANTNEAVFLLASELSELGVTPHVLYKEFFQNNTAEEMCYVGETLATIELHNERRILTMHSTLEMRLRNKLDPDSVMNITRWVQGVHGLSGIIYLREEEPGLFKISLRSVKLNVNAIAVQYGGGGHRQASGCTIAGNLADIKASLIRDVSKAIEDCETKP